MGMCLIQHLLGKLAEECAEVGKVALKAQFFGLSDINPGTGKTCRAELQAELNDVMGVMAMLQDLGLMPDIVAPDEAGIAKKKVKVAVFAQYSVSRRLLTLTPSEEDYISGILKSNPLLTQKYRDEFEENLSRWN